MSSENFAACLDLVLKHEGGLSMVRADPGNWTGGRVGSGTLKGTNFGISAASYPGEDIRRLTKARAGEIYRRDYWARVRGDDLPPGIDLTAFDPAVNSGVARGARWLQQALGVTADGRIGPVTVQAAQAAPNGVAVIQRAHAIRLGWLRSLSTWSTFGTGWMRRIVGNEAEAVAMHSRSATRLEAEGARAASTARQQTGAAAGSGAAGGIGASDLAQLPELLTYGLLIAGLVAAFVLISRARVHRARARAYARKSLEVM